MLKMSGHFVQAPSTGCMQVGTANRAACEVMPLQWCSPSAKMTPWSDRGRDSMDASGVIAQQLLQQHSRKQKLQACTQAFRHEQSQQSMHAQDQHAASGALAQDCHFPQCLLCAFIALLQLGQPG